MPRCGKVKKEWRTSDNPEVQKKIKELETCQQQREILRKRVSEEDHKEAERMRERSKTLEGEIMDIYAGNVAESHDIVNVNLVQAVKLLQEAKVENKRGAQGALMLHPMKKQKKKDEGEAARKAAEEEQKKSDAELDELFEDTSSDESHLPEKSDEELLFAEEAKKPIYWIKKAKKAEEAGEAEQEMASQTEAKKGKEAVAEVAANTSAEAAGIDTTVPIEVAVELAALLGGASESSLVLDANTPAEAVAEKTAAEQEMASQTWLHSKWTQWQRDKKHERDVEKFAIENQAEEFAIEKDAEDTSAKAAAISRDFAEIMPMVIAIQVKKEATEQEAKDPTPAEAEDLTPAKAKDLTPAEAEDPTPAKAKGPTPADEEQAKGEKAAPRRSGYTSIHDKEGMEKRELQGVISKLSRENEELKKVNE